MSDELYLPNFSIKPNEIYRSVAGLVSIVAIQLVLTGAVHAAEIEFWYGNSGRAEKTILSLCNRFNSSQVEHRVVCIGHGSYEATLQKTVAAYRAQKHPELVQVLDVGTATMVASDAFVPLHELKMAGVPTIDEKAFVGSTLDYYRSSDGNAMSLPFSTSTLVLYVNEEKLAAAGIIRAPTTWQDFEKTLSKLSESGETCPWAFRLHPWYHLEQFSALHGIRIASQNNGRDGLNASYEFADSLHLQIMRDIKRWHDNGWAVRQENLAIANGARAFGKGDCAMLLESTGVYSSIQAIASEGFSMSVHPAPVYETVERENSLVGGASMWILDGFTEQDYVAVSAFLTFLLAPENQTAMTRSTGFLPLTKDGYRLTRKSLSDERLRRLLTVARASLTQNAGGQPIGVRLGFYAQFRKIWVEEIERAFANQIGVEEALRNAELRGNRLLRRFERMYTVPGQ